MPKFKKESVAEKEIPESLGGSQVYIKTSIQVRPQFDPSDWAQHTSFTSTTCRAKAKPSLPSKLTFLTNEDVEFYMV